MLYHPYLNGSKQFTKLLDNTDGSSQKSSFPVSHLVQEQLSCLGSCLVSLQETAPGESFHLKLLLWKKPSVSLWRSICLILMFFLSQQGGVSDDVSLTAYVAAALLELDPDVTVRLMFTFSSFSLKTWLTNTDGFLFSVTSLRHFFFFATSTNFQTALCSSV